jgi:hypothetical protein
MKFDKVKKVAPKAFVEDGLFYVARVPKDGEVLFDCIVSAPFGMTLEAKHFIECLDYPAILVRAVKIGEKMVLIPVR